jgi:hypothetical protein
LPVARKSRSCAGPTHTNSAERDKSIAGELYKLARELEKMEEK